jgi:hypothetical protein
MFNLTTKDIQSIWEAYFNDESKFIFVYPSKRKKQWAILYMIAKDFNMHQTYSEKEVDAILKTYHEDYVRLRRDLIDFKFFIRTKDGSIYEKQEVSL